MRDAPTSVVLEDRLNEKQAGRFAAHAWRAATGRPTGPARVGFQPLPREPRNDYFAPPSPPVDLSSGDEATGFSVTFTSGASAIRVPAAAASVLLGAT